MVINNARPARAGLDLAPVAARIAQVQRISGEIPWHPAGKTDPWDHVEAAMGLTVGGYFESARRAFRWLAGQQLADGSWYAAYRNGQAADRTRDTNFCAYLAVGLYHFYLGTGDSDFLAEMWPTLRSAIDFTLGRQAPGGEIYWAVSPAGQVDKMALLTGSSAIHMSLKCARAIAARLNHKAPGWATAQKRLAHAVAQKPHHFNMTKSRFSMDWFYPVLSGVITGPAARQRIDRFWKKFVVEGHGVRCVSDRPWITIAETAELILTLEAMGSRAQARVLFDWIYERRFSDGGFWCGYSADDLEIWPAERMTWTDAAMLLAADSLFDLTPAGRLFRHRFWEAEQL